MRLEIRSAALTGALISGASDLVAMVTLLAMFQAPLFVILAFGLAGLLKAAVVALYSWYDEDL